MLSLVTVPRIRSVIDGARSEYEIADALRRHKIRFSFSTSTGFLHIRIRSGAGPILVYRTAGRSAPIVIRSAPTAPTAPYRVPYRTDNDY